MEIELSISPLKSEIVDSANRLTYQESILLSCAGHAVVKFNKLEMADDLEILIRIAEILSDLDACLGQDSGYFIFQFERRIAFRREKLDVLFFDRASADQLVEEVPLERIRQLRSDVREFVVKMITPLSPGISADLLSGKLAPDRSLT